MHAIRFHEYGGAEVLKYEEAPKPAPKPDELLIRVKAIGVNPVDWKMRRGDVKFLSGKAMPKIPGGDFAGVVEAAGPDAQGFKEGEEVFGAINAFKGGAYAEYLCAKPEMVARKPSSMSMTEAASLPIAALTAYQGILQICQGKAGQSILINGGSGGVGSFAIQIGRAHGLEVTAVCSSQNTAFCKELGADHVINYDRDSIASAGRKWDIFFDVVPNMNFKTTRPLIHSTGHYLSTLPGPFTMLIAPVMNLFSGRKAHSIIIKSRTADLAALADLYQSGQLKPVIQEVLPLSEGRKAHEISERGRVRGKLVLEA